MLEDRRKKYLEQKGQPSSVIPNVQNVNGYKDLKQLIQKNKNVKNRPTKKMTPAKML